MFDFFSFWPFNRKPSVPLWETYSLHSQETQTVGRMEGTVKWFDTERGFGFIVPASDGRDVFLHIYDVRGGHNGNRPYPEQGQRVRYTLLVTAKDQHRAKDVEILG